MILAFCAGVALGAGLVALFASSILIWGAFAAVDDPGERPPRASRGEREAERIIERRMGR